MEVQKTITNDEILEIGHKLAKVCEHGEESIKILKVLASWCITADQLKETGIGKKLKMVKEDFDNDLELSNEIKAIIKNLKKSWSAIYQKSKEATPTEASQPKLQKQESEEVPPSDLKLPFIREGLSSYTTADEKRDNMRL